MNLYRFLLHSSWVAIALTFLFPTSIKSAEAKTLAGEQKSQVGEADRGNKLEGKEIAKTSTEAAKLGGIVSISVSDSLIASKPPTSPAPLTPTPSAPLPSSSPPLLFPTKPEEVQIQQNQAITLQEALEIARQNNPQLQTSLLELERSRASLRESQAALYPTVSINGNITNSRSAQDRLSVESGVAPPNSDKSRTVFGGQAEVNYNIYTSGRRAASIRQASEQVRIDELNVETRHQEIKLQVTTRYYDLQAADEQVRIASAATENASASLRDAQALERAGVGTRFDVLRSQVNLANAQQDLANARARQQISQRQLASLLNLPQTINISTADRVEIAGLWEQRLEETIIQAFQNRPELQQRLAERNIGEQRRKFALGQLGPQVALVATYDVLDQFNDSVSATDGYSIGVRANWNLFDGGAARAQAAQAKANIAIAETNFANQRNQIRFEVEQYYAQLQSNLDNVQTATAALDQATEALRLARLRFQAGVGTQTDVIAAENDLTRAQGNRITAILDYNRAFANLQRAVSARN
ncbi:MAG: TolC family protein [Calothrix sp. C42_A2020_038]|nr:TolC family protein [Calothrix sp. C42_A2020_038]